MPLPKVSSAKTLRLCDSVVGVSAFIHNLSIDLEKVVISCQRVADPAAAQPLCVPTLTGGAERNEQRQEVLGRRMRGFRAR